MKAFANQARVQQKKRGKKGTKKKKKKNFKQIDETSSKWKFPLSGLISALTDIIGTRKDAVCGIDKQGQVGCLISLAIITMLLIDTSLSLPAASPDKTFDPCSKSIPERSLCSCRLSPWGKFKCVSLQGHIQSLKIFLHDGVCSFTEYFTILPTHTAVFNSNQCVSFFLCSRCLPSVSV